MLDQVWVNRIFTLLLVLFLILLFIFLFLLCASRLSTCQPSIEG